MAFCSLCGKEYDDTVKECLLSHCVVCGSTRVLMEKTTSVNPISLTVIVGFFAIVLTAIFMNILDKISVILGMMIVFILIALMEGTSSRTTYICFNCQMRGTTPLTKIPLQLSRKEASGQNPISPSSSFVHLVGQKTSEIRIGKLSLKELILIIGLIVAAIGTFFGEVISQSVRSVFN